MNEVLTPINTSSRIESLDILRGFALFGIALVNVFGFNASFFDFGGFYGNLPDPDQQNFYNVFISLSADKFIFIYSFLFGYGFALQYAKYGRLEHDFTKYYLRRLLILAFFGIFHVVFLWAGDILLLYAYGGLLLFSLRKTKSNILVILAFVFYFFISLWLTLSAWFPLPDGLSSTCTECIEKAKQIYPFENYLSCLKLRLSEYYAFRNINILYYLPKVIGIFFFGFLASRYNLHQKIKDNKLKWFYIFILITAVGIMLYLYYETWVFKILSAESAYLNAVYMGAYELMNLFIASGYILFILLVSSFQNKILKPFAYAGRMSLTNYLMQSLLFSIIFYGWGFGQFGSTNPTKFIWYAVGIFVFQVIFSYTWLKLKKQGPLEWLWRKLFYRD